MEFQLGNVGSWIMVGVTLSILAYVLYKKKTSTSQKA